MRRSRYYQEHFFPSTSFIENILLSRQQLSNILNFYDVRPRTSLQNTFLRIGTSLSKEDDQDLLGPQRDASAESNNAPKFQASNATSGSACL